MKIFFTIAVVFFCLVGTTFGQSNSKKQRWLIFEGTVVQIGKSPGILCGVTAPYRLAKYKVDKVYEGKYEKAEIIVHHLFCRKDILEDLKEGDKVLVMIDLRSPPAQISPDGEILRSEDKVDKYYAARRVAKVTTCCDF